MMESGDLPVGYGQQGLRFIPGTSQDLQGGLFVQDRFEINEQWALVGGVRADDNAFTGWEWSGRGTVLFSPTKEQTFRASRGPGLPDAHHGGKKDRHSVRPDGIPPPWPQYGAQLLGNEDLKAAYVKCVRIWLHVREEGPAAERGVLLRTTTTGSWPRSQQTAPGVIPVVKRYMNAVDGHLYGFELSGQYQVTKDVRVDGSYVWEKWVQSSDRAGGHASERGHRGRRRNRRSARGSPGSPFTDLTVNGRMWWVGDDYDLWPHAHPRILPL